MRRLETVETKTPSVTARSLPRGESSTVSPAGSGGRVLFEQHVGLPSRSLFPKGQRLYLMGSTIPRGRRVATSATGGSRGRAPDIMLPSSTGRGRAWLPSKTLARPSFIRRETTIVPSIPGARGGVNDLGS